MQNIVFLDLYKIKTNQRDQILHFDVNVAAVRKATTEELEKGLAPTESDCCSQGTCSAN